MAKKETPGGQYRVIADNRKARHDYFIDEIFEAGLVFTGTAVKSLRDGAANIAESYASEEDGELYLINFVELLICFDRIRNLHKVGIRFHSLREWSPRANTDVPRCSIQNVPEFFPRGMQLTKSVLELPRQILEKIIVPHIVII